MQDITQILSQIEAGDPTAAEALLPLVYGELRALAAARLSTEPMGQTLQATALVHEAYLRLVKSSSVEPWEGRGHFFAAAAEAMRRILVDRARRKKAAKRGGELTRVDLPADLALGPELHEDLIELDAALDQFAQTHPQQAQVVKLRYFSGLSLSQAAEILGISERTASRHWAFARAWLRRAIEGQGEKI